MKFRELLGKIAGAGNSPLGQVVTSLVPGLGVAKKVIDTANSVLGPGAVDENTTVDELEQKIAMLPPDKQALLIEKDLELQIVESNNYAAVAMEQEANKASTRPKIAIEMSDLFVQMGQASFLLVAIAIICDALLVWSLKEAFLLAILMEGLPWILGAYGVPALGIVQQYFARRSDDKRTAVSPIVGYEPKPTTFLSGLFNR